MSWRRPIASPTRNTALAGSFQVIARTPAGPVDLTTFRGAPAQVGAFSFTDPFGPEAMSLTIPQVTLLEKAGVGDLAWAKREVDVDVFWSGKLPAGWAAVAGQQLAPGISGIPIMNGRTTSYVYIAQPGTVPIPQIWRWSGYVSDLGRSSDGLTLELKGALHQLDGYLAKPEYPARPLPYEWAIQHAFAGKPALRLAPLQVAWPTWWTRTYSPVAGASSYMIPAGVGPTQPWTGLLTRSTGSWNPTLTGYVQSLLTSMYTERGRWTIDLNGRTPMLFHRDRVYDGSRAVIVIDPVDPGVKIDLHEDGDQALTSVYGQGTGLNGVTYSGMQVSSDGSQTSYEPLAALRQVHPPLTNNLWYDNQRMVREVYLQMQAGLSEDDAMVVARNHLTTYAEPGYTGTITLQSDPLDQTGAPILKHLVRAGMSVKVPGFNGDPEGVVLHVSRSEHDVGADTTTLTVDAKFRDALTVEEVRLRGRDSLSVSRMLVAGQYSPPVPDQILPWDYSAGSGYIPSNDTFNAVPLFAGMPNSVEFPWTDWTVLRPPSDPRWRSSYLRRTPASPTTADANWIVQDSPSGHSMGVPIRMAQAGTVRLLQVAAYNADGTVAQVPFHVSFYYVGGVNVSSMPAIPATDGALYAPYGAGQHYPFVRDGFETVRSDGTQVDPNVPQPIQSVGLIRAYGTYYEKAGYFPGSYAGGDQPTGLLVDESSWSFDVTGVGAAYWDPYNAERDRTNPLSGRIFAMIYCDANVAQDVYFLGRIFRVEPGTGST